MKKIISLLKKYEIKNKTDLISICIYSDESGSVLDRDDNIIFNFHGEKDLVEKLTSDNK